MPSAWMDLPMLMTKGPSSQGPVRKETDCARQLGLECPGGARLQWHMNFADFTVLPRSGPGTERHGWAKHSPGKWEMCFASDALWECSWEYQCHFSEVLGWALASPTPSPEELEEPRDRTLGSVRCCEWSPPPFCSAATRPQNNF